MNKKIKIWLFVLIIIGVITLCLTSKNKVKINKAKKQRVNNLAIMIKNENGTYVSSNVIPKGNYILNEEKTICENGGKVVSYNNSTGQIGFNFLGSDRCSLYFDKIIDLEKPIIKSLNVSGTAVTATLTDNQGLSGYGFTSSSTKEPTSWTSISGTLYSLNVTINTEGLYYLWVKDSSGNKIVSDVIDLERKGYQTILINNGNGATSTDSAINYIKEKGTPNFANVATNNEGMYAAEDDLGTSYYFRGAVNNNWVKFGKDSSGKYIYWRIIRINGDGSIRMIYTGTTAPTSSTSVKMTGTGTIIGTVRYNTNYNSSVYVGYMYTVGEQHGNKTSSTIKTAIDNWYKTTTLETDNLTKKLVADQIFCNDRSVSSGTWTTSSYVDYSPYTRLVTNKTPILTCPTVSDKFTVNKNNGNGALTYPVGLITIDELAMAGGVNEMDNTSYYLYINNTYLTGSPSNYNKSYSSVFEVYSVGYLQSSYVDYIDGIRPVISLSPTVKLSGDGTYNNPYIVS